MFSRPYPPNRKLERIGNEAHFVGMVALEVGKAKMKVGKLSGCLGENEDNDRQQRQQLGRDCETLS